MRSLTAFLPNFDVIHTQNAIKITLGFCIATSIALALHWHKPYWASFTAIMLLNKPLLGNSIQNASGRIIASLIGGIVGLMLVNFFIQQPWLFTLAMGLWLFACSLMACHSNNSFTYILASLTAVLIALGSLSNPAILSVDLLQSRLLEICLGIITGLVISSFLWPRQAAKAFSKSIRQLLTECEQLIALMSKEYCQQQLSPRYQQLELLTLQALDTLPDELFASKQESFHHSYHYENYQFLIDAIYELVCHLHGLHEALQQDLDYSLQISNPKKTQFFFDSLQHILHLLKQIDVAKPKPINLDLLTPLQNELHQCITYLKFDNQNSLYDHAKCLTIYRQFLECCEAVITINQALQAIRQRKKLKEHPRHISSSHKTHWIQFRERCLKSFQVALIGSCAMIIWFYANWPGASGPILMALLIGLLNIILPITIDEVLRAFALAFACASIVYLFIFPHCETLLGFNLACVLPILYFGYFCSDPNTSRFGVLCITFFISLLNINSAQTISFTLFMTTSLGDLLGILLALVVICVLWPRQAEFRFINHCKLLLNKARIILDLMQHYKPQNKKTKKNFSNARKQLLEYSINMQKHQQLIEQKNHPDLNLNQLNILADSLQTLAFRMDALTSEREKIISHEAFKLIRHPFKQLRQRMINQLNTWFQYIQNSRHSIAFYDFSKEFETLDEALKNIEINSAFIPIESIASILSVLNCYRSLSMVFTQLDQHIQSINWQQLRRIH